MSRFGTGIQELFEHHVIDDDHYSHINKARTMTFFVYLSSVYRNPYSVCEIFFASHSRYRTTDGPAPCSPRSIFIERCQCRLSSMTIHSPFFRNFLPWILCTALAYVAHSELAADKEHTVITQHVFMYA